MFEELFYERLIKLRTEKGVSARVYRPPKVRPKNLTIGGRYFYG